MTDTKAQTSSIDATAELGFAVSEVGSTRELTAGPNGVIREVNSSSGHSGGRTPRKPGQFIA